ncbi:MAG TPA: hypothetical protein VFY18_03915 [Candidatus Limnocylindrales bacterium]|nr:hypothetical protein [Candidatus Limnocylindrales bacterium]
MNDELETRLRDAFRHGSLPATPERLLDHLIEVPNVPLVGGAGRDRRAGSGRRPWGALAVAAVLLVGGAVAVAVGSRGPSPLPIEGPSPTAVPSTGGAVRLTYQPQWTAKMPLDAAVLADTVSIIQQRIDATGLVGARVATDDQSRIVVDLPSLDDPDAIRRLVGQTAHVEFVPVDDLVERGTPLDPAKYPALLDSSEIAGSSVGVDDQNGTPTLNITLTGSGGTKFGDYTAAHIGSFVAITFDRQVVVAPMINEAIRDGIIQITSPAGEIDPHELAALIRFGPLPVAINEVATGPVPTGPSAVATAPVGPSPAATAP